MTRSGTTQRLSDMRHGRYEVGVRTTKLLGSIKRSGHVPGQPEVAYELPAQSPTQHALSVC